MDDEKEQHRLRQIQIDLHHLARPFVQLKCDILALSIPTMRLRAGEPPETIYSPEVVSQLEKIDKLWEEEKQRYFQNRADFGPNGDATTPGFFVTPKEPAK